MAVADMLLEDALGARKACVRRGAAILAVVAFVGATAGPAGAAPPRQAPTPGDSAVSQYVEQIPTAHGSDPSSAQASKGAAPSNAKRIQRAAVASGGQLGVGALLAIALGGAAATVAAAFAVRRRLR